MTDLIVMNLDEGLQVLDPFIAFIDKQIALGKEHAHWCNNCMCPARLNGSAHIGHYIMSHTLAATV